MVEERSESVLVATAEIDATAEKAKCWFLELSDHPERYAFESHEGFTFTEGAFGEEGARFETHERFMGVPQTLKFVLTEVGDRQFAFELRQPFTGIWGRFILKSITPRTTELQLEIGGRTRAKRLLLKVPIVSQAIRSQIQREVDHIKASIEKTAS